MGTYPYKSIETIIYEHQQEKVENSLSKIQGLEKEIFDLIEKRNAEKNFVKRFRLEQQIDILSKEYAVFKLK